MSGIWLQDSCKLAINWKKDNEVTISWVDVIVKIFWRCLVSLVKFSYWVKFYVNIKTDSGAIWQFSFIKDWPEIWKSEIPSSEFYPISGDWGKVALAHLAQMFLIKSYWIVQNSKVTVFTVSELLRENQLGGKITLSPSLTQNMVKGV